jgi:hypothetical protein
MFVRLSTYLSAYNCSLLYDERLGERQDALEIVHTSWVITFYWTMNVISLCLSLCRKSIHAKQHYSIYIYTNMIKGYIARHVSIIVWTNHFVHNSNTRTQENMISGGDRSRLCLIRTDTSTWGKVRSYTTIKERIPFLIFLFKTISYVPRQMVNVHEQ